ncbi:MAG: YicC/YloC family endoribonuclease [Balneolaceae bacterium]|nr:YicC/YloC family endoribonuclease [Balneolaceae bacterium]
MIISMTGFGRGEASSDGLSVTVEIKSVNSRYLDINLRIPQSIQEKELELKEMVQDHISRGKVNANVRVDQAQTGEPDITISRPLVKGYMALLEELRQVAGIESPVTLRNLMQFNDIFISKEKDESTLETIWQLTRSATGQALQHLNEMRHQEGKQLEKDLIQRVDHIGTMLDKVAAETEGRAEEERKKLNERIQALMQDEQLDPERLEQEIAILADKLDITEEIVRIRSHLKFFHEAIEQDESVGRRLNFLSQEINREINTIGSKSNSSEISQYVVKAKESLEQIREQVQNIE